MVRTITDEQLKNVIDLFKKYIDDELITFVNCGGLSVLAYENQPDKGIKRNKIKAAEWFNCFDRAKDFTLMYPDLDLNKILDYVKNENAIIFNNKDYRDLAYWLNGQQANLTRKQMQPYQFVLLSLSGFEFKRENPNQRVAYDDMIMRVNDSDILSEYMVLKDDEIKWEIPQGIQDEQASNSDGGKKMGFFRRFSLGKKR